MKFRAYHLYFIVLLVSGLVGAYLDLNYTYQLTENPELNGWFGFFYFMGFIFPIATSVLVGYYLIVYFYRRRNKISKSYI